MNRDFVIVAHIGRMAKFVIPGCNLRDAEYFVPLYVLQASIIYQRTDKLVLYLGHVNNIK